MEITALGFVCGVWVLQQQATLLTSLWLTVMAASLALIVLLRRLNTPQTIRLLTTFIVAVVVGFMYATIFAHLRLDDALPKAWEQQNITVVGVVATLSEVNARGERFRFDVEQVLTPEAQVPKHIALNYYQDDAWQPSTNHIEQARLLRPSTFKAGERWKVTVRLKRPHSTYNPHGYDFEAWALAQNIRAMGYIRNQQGMRKMTDFVWQPRYMIAYCREKVGYRITKALGSQPYAGVVRALVIGDHSQIDTQDWEVYLRTGTNHLMSISGLHITMLAGLAFSLIAFCWRRFPRLVLVMPTRKAAIIGAAIVALLYACLAGLSVPTQRTLMMLMTFAVALLLNKSMPMSRVLIVALLLVVLIDPWAVIAPGFWLSFTAVAFIAYTVANRLNTRHWLAEAINTQWSITLGLLPFLILMFGQASFVSPIANALAIPVISLLVVPLAIFGALLPFYFILHGAQQILAICMIALNWLSSSPLAIWQQAAPPGWAIALSILGVLWLMLPRGFPQRWLGGLLLLPMIFTQPKPLALGEMQLAVLDVGQGLSVVVKTEKHVMVYDAGPKYSQENDAGKQIVLPYLRGQGIQQLDALIVSHDDNDHSGGAASLLAQLPTDWVASSYVLPETDKPMPKQLNCYAGQQWVWDAVVFEVLYPTLESYHDERIKDNNRSCVIKVTSPYGSVLLTGDIEAQAEQLLLDSQQAKLKSDVLVAPHHGSKTSSSEALISATQAKDVIFTVGYLNRFNHPKPAIVSRYQASGANLYRSDTDGAVVVDFAQEQAPQINSWRALHRRYWQD